MKLYNYAILGVMFIILLQLFGFSTSASQFIQFFGINNLESIQSSEFWIQLAKILGGGGLLVGGGAIVASKFTNVSPIFAIKTLIFMTPLAALIMDFVGLLTRLGDIGQPWLYSIFSVILVPFIVGYIITLIEWWGGTD